MQRPISSPQSTHNAPSADLAASAEIAEIKASLQRWIEAFNLRKPAQICALYHPEAVLWGTTAQALITSPDGLRQYFEGHCAALTPLTVTLTDQRVRVFGDFAVNSGSYTLATITREQCIGMPARFSFTYQRTGGDWLIVDHHSSWVPGAQAPAAPESVANGPRPPA